MCPRYKRERTELEKLLAARLIPGNIVPHMIRSHQVWDQIREWSAVSPIELKKGVATENRETEDVPGVVQKNHKGDRVNGFNTEILA